MKKYLFLSAVIILLGVLILSGCAAPAPAPSPSPAPTAKPSPAPTTPAATAKEPWGGVKFIRFADGSAGDPAMEMWGLVCTYWSQIPGIQANAFAASSGTQIFQISEGAAEVGTIYGSQIMRYRDVKNLPTGKTKPATNVTSMYTWSTLYGAIFVRADSKIKTFDDLKSATIGGNLGESSFGGTALALLEAAGITIKGIGQTGGKLSTITTTAASDGLRDKTLDAWIYGGTPVAASEAAPVLSKEIPLRIIRPTKEQVEKALKLHPEFVVSTLDWSKELANEKEPLTTLGDTIMIGIRTDLPDDLVYEMVKKMHESDLFTKIRRLGPSHVVRWPENARIGSDVWGEHPGAKKYFEDTKIPVNKNFVIKSG